MLRTISIAGAVAALVAVAAPPALAGSPTAVKLDTCRQALEQGGRLAVFTAQMRSLRRGDRMSMRFDLLRSAPGETEFARVDAPGMGKWNRAQSGVPAYVFRQRVVNLPAPAVYRVRVTFRWKGPGDRPAATAQRTSPVCRQPDLRPDLTVALVGIQPAEGDQVDYTVDVTNAGRSYAGASGGFDVVLRVGPQSQPVTTVTGLKAGESVRLTFRAPRCAAGDSVAAVADPDARVTEAEEGNNLAAQACAASRRR